MSKQRMTVSVDEDLVSAGAAAVAAGRAASVSAWVNQALVEKAANDLRIDALAEAIAAYEEEHGAISDEELVEQVRSDRDAAAARRSSAKRRGVA